MRKEKNIIEFSDIFFRKREYEKRKYSMIRDEIESVLVKYSKLYADEWAVVLAAGRFSSMRLQQIEGSDSSIDFFKKCIETQERKNIIQ